MQSIRSGGKVFRKTKNVSEAATFDPLPGIPQLIRTLNHRVCPCEIQGEQCDKASARRRPEAVRRIFLFPLACRQDEKLVVPDAPNLFSKREQWRIVSY